MVSFFDKLKHQIDMWRIEKYTKRRTFLPEYDSKDKEYYDRYYRDGVYYTADAPPSSTPSSSSSTSNNTPLEAIKRAPSKATKRASTLLRRPTTSSSLKRTRAPRCSETYNAQPHACP